MSNTMNYEKRPPVLRYMGNEYMGGEVKPIMEITYSDYGNLSQTEISNNCYYITDYTISDPAISYYGVIFIPEGGD